MQLRLFTIPTYDIHKDIDHQGIIKMSKVLVSYFNKCIKFTKFDSVEHFLFAKAAEVTRNDLVCYLLADKADSIIRKKGGMLLGKLNNSSNTAWSPADNAVICEIYLAVLEDDADKASLAANMIFHEYAHSRLDDGFHKPIAGHTRPVHMHDIPGVLLLSGKEIRSDWEMGPVDEHWMRMGLKLAHLHAPYTGSIPAPGSLHK